MAIVLNGSTQCALCERVLQEGDDLVATSAFIEDPSHRLFRYSDAAMHRGCFLKWKERAGFVDYFNAYYNDHYRGILRMLADGTIEEHEPRGGRAV